MKYIEIWKDLKYPNVKDIYQVSNTGKIRNKHTKKNLKNDIRKNGYAKVGLYHKFKKASVSISIHRLVALHFKKNDILSYNQVNHIDGKKLNNRSKNLEWVDQSYNQKHAIQLGLQPSGEDRVNAVYNNKMIHDICNLLQQGYRTKDIVHLYKDIYNIQDLKNLISDIKKKNSWSFISDKYDIHKDTRMILKNIIIELYLDGNDKNQIFEYLTNELCYNLKPNYIKDIIKNYNK